MLVAFMSVSSYATSFSNPAISLLSDNLKEEGFINDDYIPPWLEKSMNMSGYSLSILGKFSLTLGLANTKLLTKAINTIGFKWILEYANLDDADLRKFAIASTLSDSGIYPDDPEPFNYEEMSRLNKNDKFIKRAAYERDYDQQNNKIFDDIDAGGVRELHRLYMSDEITPVKIAMGVLSWLSASNGIQPHLKDAVIKRTEHDSNAIVQARSSEQRWKNCHANFNNKSSENLTNDEMIDECMEKNIINPLDGVPIFVKDEINVAGYTTSAGLNPGKMNIDGNLKIHDDNSQSEVVTRLVDAGVVVLGKSNQHIFGLGATGLNPLYSKLSNVFSKDHVPGGSSSGSAVLVALNAAPFALGTDGGGSVSIPAMNNGLPGLKPSEGTIPTANYDNPAEGLVSIGIIGKNFNDIKLAYKVSAKKEPTESVMETIKTIKIGIDKEFFKSTEEVANISMTCLDTLGQALQDEIGGKPVIAPMQILPEGYRKRLWASHIILFGHAEAVGNNKYINSLHLPAETRLALLMGSALSDRHVEEAKKNQQLLIKHMDNNIFSKFDVIAMPTAMVTAPGIEPSWDVDGELNLTKAYKMSGNTSPANLTGDPRVTVHCGFDKNNLPVGLQLWGPKGSDFLLMKMGEIVEPIIAEKLQNHPAWGKKKTFDIKDQEFYRKFFVSMKW